MPEFLDRILGRAPAKKTGTVAKERLQFILVHDRINLPPERMEAMKKEILEVIAKYVSVDNENVDIALQKRDRSSIIRAEIPFIKAREGVEFEDPDDKPNPNAAMLSDADDEPLTPPANHAVSTGEPSVDDLASEASSSQKPAGEEKPPASGTPRSNAKTKSSYTPKRKR